MPSLGRERELRDHIWSSRVSKFFKISSFIATTKIHVGSVRSAQQQKSSVERGSCTAPHDGDTPGVCVPWLSISSFCRLCGLLVLTRFEKNGDNVCGHALFVVRGVCNTLASQKGSQAQVNIIKSCAVHLWPLNSFAHAGQGRHEQDGQPICSNTAVGIQALLHSLHTC